MTNERRARVLVVGGFDPSGAGVDADRAALAGLDVEVLVVLTARTDQDARGVRSIGARDVAEWFAEALQHLEQGVDALKLGLLPGAEHVRAAARLARAARALDIDVPIVVDPVIAASSGSRFLDAAAVEMLRGDLLGEDVIATPNVAEAAELARLPAQRLMSSFAARVDAAQMLLGLGARAVIVKGGHGLEDPVRDLVLERDAAVVSIDHARVPGGKVRGSGCRYASRLAARLAQHWSLAAAARDAAEHVAAAIGAAPRR